MPPPVVPRGPPGPGQVAGSGSNSALNIISGMGMAPAPLGAVTGGGPLGLTSPTSMNAAANMGNLALLEGNPPIPVPQTPSRQPSLPPTSLTSPGVAGPSGVVPAKAVPGIANGKATASPAPQPTPVTKIIPQLPPLPATVKLDPKVTRVSVVPLVDSETMISPLAEDEIQHVQEWMKADKEYEARYKKMRERMTEELKTTVSAPRAWWERDFNASPEERRRRADKFVLTGLKSSKEREIRDKRRVGRREGLRV